MITLKRLWISLTYTILKNKHGFNERCSTMLINTLQLFDVQI